MQVLEGIAVPVECRCWDLLVVPSTLFPHGWEFASGVGSFDNLLGPVE